MIYSHTYPKPPSIATTQPLAYKTKITQPKCPLANAMLSTLGQYTTLATPAALFYTYGGL